MSRASIKITERGFGLDQMIAALGELAEGKPQREIQGDLDDVLRRTAEISRTLAHIDEGGSSPGSLKASIEPHSEHGAPYGWTGEVRSADRGARYEFQRGGSHAEFITSLAHLSHADFEAALDSMFNNL